ncbi:hypothetical protein C8J57DRAFT_1236093 [Mycena rebaudengoi]|nr:hypothetical protein C8J57DRAFT_1236093 [Mycena rebaudengoi]
MEYFQYAGPIFARREDVTQFTGINYSDKADIPYQLHTGAPQGLFRVRANGTMYNGATVLSNTTALSNLPVFVQQQEPDPCGNATLDLQVVRSPADPAYTPWRIISPAGFNVFAQNDLAALNAAIEVALYKVDQLSDSLADMTATMEMINTAIPGASVGTQTLVCHLPTHLPLIIRFLPTAPEPTESLPHYEPYIGPRHMEGKYIGLKPTPSSFNDETSQLRANFTSTSARNAGCKPAAVSCSRESHAGGEHQCGEHLRSTIKLLRARLCGVILCGDDGVLMESGWRWRRDVEAFEFLRLLEMIRINKGVREFYLPLAYHQDIYTTIEATDIGHVLWNRGLTGCHCAWSGATNDNQNEFEKNQNNGKTRARVLRENA